MWQLSLVRLYKRRHNVLLFVVQAVQILRVNGAQSSAHQIHYRFPLMCGTSSPLFRRLRVCRQMPPTAKKRCDVAFSRGTVFCCTRRSFGRVTREYCQDRACSVSVEARVSLFADHPPPRFSPSSISQGGDNALIDVFPFIAETMISKATGVRRAQHPGRSQNGVARRPGLR